MKHLYYKITWHKFKICVTYRKGYVHEELRNIHTMKYKKGNKDDIGKAEKAETKKSC